MTTDYLTTCNAAFLESAQPTANVTAFTANAGSGTIWLAGSDACVEAMTANFEELIGYLNDLASALGIDLTDASSEDEYNLWIDYSTGYGLGMTFTTDK